MKNVVATILSLFLVVNLFLAVPTLCLLRTFLTNIRDMFDAVKEYINGQSSADGGGKSTGVMVNSSVRRSTSPTTSTAVNRFTSIERS